MNFAEKLSFLMEVTATSNSALAHAVTLDASYISRLRRGKRLYPRDEGCVRAMAAWFARHCVQDYQQKAIAEAVGAGLAAGTPLGQAIEGWLRDGGQQDSQRVDRFLANLSGVSNKAVTVPARPQGLPGSPADAVTLYYGVEGKRQAVLAFLDAVIAAEQPQTLLLFSDEETSWMTGDMAFARQWARRMGLALQRGNRIRIVHTIQRDVDEMFRAIGQWMPLYMGGAIEPYFCPRKRDGLFRRTLFLAPQTAAVVSNSMGEHTDGAVNLLFLDADAIGAYVEEFCQYLRLCRKLMRIFTQRDQQQCMEALLEFDRPVADTLIKTESLSTRTMPEGLLEEILGTAATPWLNIHSVRRRGFLHGLGDQEYHEMIALPDPQALRQSAVPVAMANMLGSGAARYTTAQYGRHLRYMAQLLREHPRFHVHIERRPAEDGYAIYARENVGVIVAKTSQPPLVLAMNEGNMTAAFWDFLLHRIGERAFENPDNDATAAQLLQYADQLECW